MPFDFLVHISVLEYYKAITDRLNFTNRECKDFSALKLKYLETIFWNQILVNEFYICNVCDFTKHDSILSV